MDSLRDHGDEQSETDLLDHSKINMYMRTASIFLHLTDRGITQTTVNSS